MTETQSQQIGDGYLETYYFVSTNLFAYIFLSQIIDNLREPKNLFIVFEVLLSLSLLSDGIQMKRRKNDDLDVPYTERLGLML